MSNGWIACESVNWVLPVALLVALLDLPQGSLALGAPSPKGSLAGEEAEGGAGDPHASSVLAGAEWTNRADESRPHNSNLHVDPFLQSQDVVSSVIN